MIMAPLYFPTAPANAHTEIPPTSFNILSAFTDLPFENPDLLLHAFPAIDAKNDTLTQSQMLKDADKVKFLQAQQSEIQGLQKMKVFDIKHISTKPTTAKLLSSIWSYRKKRSPLGKKLKHKACLCVDGSQQQHGRDYWETYAPVVSWSTIRLILLSNILYLKS